MKTTTLLLSLSLVACTDHEDAITGTQSLAIELVAPTSPGSLADRLPDSQHAVTVNVRALDEQGELDTSYSGTIGVYAQFLGTLTPELGEVPQATITVTNGVAMAQNLTLPDSVLGPTTLWFDNGNGVGRDYEHGAVTGTSPVLWYRDPFISDIQTPRDEVAVDALSITPLTDKQVTVAASRYGANGKLIVTSVFAQGYTVSDVDCSSTPCKSLPYDHVMVFSFSAPRDEAGNPLAIGDVVRRFNGGVSEFNGLTEIGFPRTYLTDATHMTRENLPASLPAPVLFEAAWFGPLSNPAGRINFERNEGGPIKLVNAKVCPTDDDYTTYKQWKVAPDNGSCAGDNVINLITQGTDFTTDPTTLVGQVLPSIVGILRPVNIGSFNVWIVYPRGSSDISL